MPVGTGSINRAAKTGRKAAGPAESTVKTEEAKKTAAKTPSAQKGTAPKKAVPKKKVSNECYQLTQELPIHLL